MQSERSRRRRLNLVDRGVYRFVLRCWVSVDPPKRDPSVGGRATVIASSTIPAQIGQYRVERELGRGGMGVVYLARDPRLDRPVAVKVLPAESKNETTRRRFEREARAAARLSHPNIATIYELGDCDQPYFIAMEYVAGRSLRDHLLSMERMALEEVLRIAIQIAEGLIAAHASKIVHRDLKPQNVMLTPEGQVKILDFGVAQFLEPTRIDQAAADVAEPATAEQNIVGTAGYMSPEQIRGESVDTRCDIFAFGVVLYEMASGKTPFLGETDADLLSAILRDTPVPVIELNPGLPPEFDRIVSRCLEKDPLDRYPSAQLLVDDLRAFSGSATPSESQEIPSIAVLPFANMSADPENEYFTDGMAEEITNALSKIKALRVASRTSAFAFKDRQEDIRNIGRQLNVQSVLEGSVRKANNRLRITGQLINVADGFHLWSERYDREMEDVFAVQDEIAQNIAQALRVVLTDKEKRAISKVPTANVEAYHYYLRGRQSLRRFRRQGQEFARQMFEQAIEIDPAYALAYAGVADCWSTLYMWWDQDEANLHEADQASHKALELDPDLAEAHVARGLAVSLREEFDEASAEFETAIRSDPQLFDAYYHYARACVVQGKLQEATKLFEQACLVRPEDYQAPTALGMTYDAQGREAEAEAINRQALEVVEKHLELNPDDTRAVYHAANNWAYLGERALALEWAERAVAMEPEEPYVVYNVACVYAKLGQTDEALDLLARAVACGFGSRRWFDSDPDLDPLRDHPRFAALLDSIQ